LQADIAKADRAVECFKAGISEQLPRRGGVCVKDELLFPSEF
jgi:hypothetical protein